MADTHPHNDNNVWSEARESGKTSRSWDAERQANNNAQDASVIASDTLYDFLDGEDDGHALSQSDADWSMPAGLRGDSSEEELDGNIMARSESVDAVVRHPQLDLDLIDLAADLNEEKKKIENGPGYFEYRKDRAEKLTEVRSEKLEDRKKENQKSSNRAASLKVDDRYDPGSPTKSRQGGAPPVLPPEPSSPKSQRSNHTHRSERYQFTYETVENAPLSPVPPYVFVPPGGSQAKVTVKPTGRVVCPPGESQPEVPPRNNSSGLLRKACILAVVALFVLAIITMVAGLIRKRELNSAATNSGGGPLSGLKTPSPTIEPTDATPTDAIPSPGTFFPSLVVTTNPPTPSPEFVIPVDGLDPTVGDVIKETTPSPVAVQPTRPPRATLAPVRSTPIPTRPPPTEEPSFSTPKPSPSPMEPPSPRPTKVPSPVPTSSPSTSSPSSSPTTAVQGYLARTLEIASSISLHSLSDTTSDQYKALQWLAGEESVMTKYTVERLVQRWVLATLYYSTIGEEWNESTGWLKYTDECFWFSNNAGGMCNDRKEVRNLDLEDNGLKGTVPRELSLLSNSLTRLFLRDNSIGGTLPTELGMLYQLEYLQLTRNQIHGTLPTELGLLSEIVVLGLGRNSLEGLLPPQLGQLGKIWTFGLERNSLFGGIPSEWSGMTNIRHLGLDFNELSGPVDESLASLSNLEKLSLRGNLLDGTMPSKICALNIARLTADCDEIECPCCEGCCYELQTCNRRLRGK